MPSPDESYQRPGAPLPRGLLRTLWGTFLTGLIAIIPIAATLYVVVWLFTAADALLGGIAQPFLPDNWHIPGIGIVLAILLVLGLGAILQTGILGPPLISLTERVFERIPFVKSVYRGARDLLQFLSHKPEGDHRHVALVTLPGDIRLIGFITDTQPAQVITELADVSDEPLLTVYLPMSYQIGGYTLYLPASCVQRLEMPVEEAMRMVLTAGMNRQRGATSHQALDD